MASEISNIIKALTNTTIFQKKTQPNPTSPPQAKTYEPAAEAEESKPRKIEIVRSEMSTFWEFGGNLL